MGLTEFLHQLEHVCLIILHYHTVLDEATSSLSEEDELHFYSSLQQLGITVLSIGHRSTLQEVYYNYYYYTQIIIMLKTLE